MQTANKYSNNVSVYLLAYLFPFSVYMTAVDNGVKIYLKEHIYFREIVREM